MDHDPKTVPGIHTGIFLGVALGVWRIYREIYRGIYRKQIMRKLAWIFRATRRLFHLCNRTRRQASGVVISNTFWQVRRGENQMKKKFFRLSAAVLLFFSGIMEIGWRFFNRVVCCKRGERKKERKQWFELSHIRDNHPRNGYAKEYEESRAWC